MLILLADAEKSLFCMMGKRIAVLLILSLTGTNLPAQEMANTFVLKAPKRKPQKSLYKSIQFVDSRKNKSFIGEVGPGLFRRKPRPLVLRSPVKPQLDSIFQAMIDSTAGRGTLLFQLRKLRFTETHATRFCNLIATLYVRSGNRYLKLVTLDTVMIQSGGTYAGIRYSIETQASVIIDSFLSKAIQTVPMDTAGYTLAEIAKIDSIEKQQLSIYTTAGFVDGLYRTYNSFSMQRPDWQCSVRTDQDGFVTGVDILDLDGKRKKVRPREAYAIVAGGKPFISTGYGYYPLQKIDDEFYFTGKVWIPATTGEQFLAALVLDLDDNGESVGSVQRYRLMLDHLNGGFIHVRYIGKR